MRNAKYILPLLLLVAACIPKKQAEPGAPGTMPELEPPRPGPIPKGLAGNPAPAEPGDDR